MDTYVITTALIRYKKKYLIGKRAKSKKFAPGQWEFISGFVDEVGSAEEIILRELQEETALRGKIVRSGNPYTVRDQEGRWIVLPFVINTTSDNFVLNKEDHSELRWISVSELSKYRDIVPFLKGFKKQSLVS